MTGHCDCLVEDFGHVEAATRIRHARRHSGTDNVSIEFKPLVKLRITNQIYRFPCSTDDRNGQNSVFKSRRITVSSSSSQAKTKSRMASCPATTERSLSLAR